MELFPRSRVPDSASAVIAERDESGGVGAQGETAEPLLVDLDPAQLSFGAQVPQVRTTVLGRRGGHRTVGGDVQVPDAVAVAELGDDALALDVPDAQGEIARAGEHVLPVGMEREAVDTLAVSVKFRHLLTGVRVPHARGGVRAPGGDEATVGGEGNLIDGSRVSDKAMLFLTRGEVPDADRLVLRPGDEGRAVRREGAAVDQRRVPADDPDGRGVLDGWARRRLRSWIDRDLHVCRTPRPDV